ncbi:MAG: CHY zinc finger protein [Cyclobacteriaceae bacterium]
MTSQPAILGKPVDEHTRCIHYHSDLDIIAIRFKCCSEYYPCFECHQETANHDASRWQPGEFGEKAILCGMCRHELTIQEYLDCGNQCPNCGAKFNPGCAKHYHLYFELPANG